MQYKIVRVYASPHYAPTTQVWGVDLATAKAHCHGPDGSSASTSPSAVRHTRQYGEWRDVYKPFVPRPDEVYVSFQLNRSPDADALSER